MDGDHWTWIPPAKNGIVVFVLAALLVAETLVPMFPNRERRLSHGVANLAWGVLNATFSGVLFATAIVLITDWSHARTLGLLQQLPSTTPKWVSFGIGLLLIDFWMYWWHRLNHTVPLFWRFHAVHHTDRELDCTSAVRFHTGEIILSCLARLLIFPALGVSLPMLLVYELVLLPVILFHHSNVRIAGNTDSLLRALIVTPWLHWVHHSQERVETNSNYGSVLSCWDRLFKTFKLRQAPQDIQFGLAEDPNEKSWRTLIGMLIRPFKRY